MAPSRLTLLLPLLLMLFLSGCGDLMDARRSRAELPLDFAASLPTGWQAVDTWHEVNIDGDLPTEYLLLFRFDVGQIGAVIYDGQINGAQLERSGESAATRSATSTVKSTVIPTVTPAVTPTATPAGEATTGEDVGASPAVTPNSTNGATATDDAADTPDGSTNGSANGSVPSQGFGYYRPYRLLPSYWAFSYGGDPGHGMVAPPGYDEAIGVIPVPYAGENNRDNDNDETPSTPAELVLIGGERHLTFVWWKNPVEGYGVTQLVAQGGFIGIDWDEWMDAPTPITAISGLEPLRDYRSRSQICRQIDYIRRVRAMLLVDDEDVIVEQDVITAEVTGVEFAEEDRGLRFCSDFVPPYPFYPEGVVLAYLQRPPRGDRTLEPLVAPGLTTAQLDADGALERLPRERIEDIATYRTIPVPPSGVQTGEFAPTTSVCVHLTEREDPSIQRWLVFTLRYQPPEMATQLPDRWVIAGVRFEPQPVTPPQRPYCETVLARSAP